MQFNKCNPANPVTTRQVTSHNSFASQIVSVMLGHGGHGLCLCFSGKDIFISLDTEASSPSKADDEASPAIGISSVILGT